jgi:hypothetical protein
MSELLRPSWIDRAPEQSNLFNPAFMATLLWRMVDDYSRKSRGPMPLALGFLLPAIVLHRRTRHDLPGTTVTSLLPWLQEHREHLVTFSGRVRKMKPLTQEGLMFGLLQDCLALNSEGLFKGRQRLSPTTIKKLDLTDEARSCIERSAFLGRWFADAGTPATILAAWGVAP